MKSYEPNEFPFFSHMNFHEITRELTGEIVRKNDTARQENNTGRVANYFAIDPRRAPRVAQRGPGCWVFFGAEVNGI